MAAGAPDNVSVGVFQMVVDAEEQDGEKASASARTTRRVSVLSEAPESEAPDSQGSMQTRKLSLAP